MDGNLQELKRSAPTDARQVRSRNALNAALLTLLEHKPFDQLTIREITAEAGTGYATFFRHYPTKEALLSDVASEEIAGLLAMAVPMLYETNSFQSTLALCTYVSAHSRLWSALLTGGAAGLVRREFIRQARGLVPDSQPSISGLPLDLGVVHGAGATIDVLAWWLSQENKEYPAGQIAEILHRLVIAPLVGDHAEIPPQPE